MLSPVSPSLLLSALQSVLAGEAASPAGGETAPGFADLLNGLAAKAVEAVSGKDGDAEPAEAATENGNILPVALPEAAKGDEKAAPAAESETLEDKVNVPAAMLALPAAVTLQQAPATGADQPVPTTKASRRPAGASAQALLRAAPPVPGQSADKHKPEAPVAEGRPVNAVAITVATSVQPAAAAAAITEATEARAVAPVRSKPARAADLLRIEAPQASAPAPVVTQVAQVDPAAPATNVPAVNMPNPMPSPNDIDAALDHLVAAREALMPAEAALSIDHAEFGEVSIKIEQTSDGRLSAELTAADPELKRAVTAATATDRGPATNSDGDNGRSAQTANRSSTAGGDAASGERGQSSTQAGADRDGPQRRAQTRSQGGQAATDQRPGVFA